MRGRMRRTVIKRSSFVKTNKTKMTTNNSPSSSRPMDRWPHFESIVDHLSMVMICVIQQALFHRRYTAHRLWLRLPPPSPSFLLWILLFGRDVVAKKHINHTLDSQRR